MSKLKTINQIEKIATKLGKSYSSWKKFEKAKERDRENFFKAASILVADNAADEDLFIFEGIGDKQEVEKEALKRYPHCIIYSIRMLGEDKWEVLLEVSPDYLPFVYVNRSDGMVYQRAIATSAAILDEEQLKEREPKLWEKISKEEIIRTLIPLDQLDPETLARVQDYIYPGKPSVRLLAPREASEEELDDV